MHYKSLAPLYLLILLTVSSTFADYTNPARIEEVEKKTAPTDTERSGDDPKKASEKQRRYEQTERKIKELDKNGNKMKDRVYPSNEPSLS